MEVFMDRNGGRVTLTFESGTFQRGAMHVLVLCRYNGKWLLTNHRERGLEFPGGKVEEKESLDQAARREVLEETGAHLESLYPIGEYEVVTDQASFVKAIFYGVVDRLEERDCYFETKGPVLVEGDLLTERFREEYSFIMKDLVVEKAIQYIEEYKEKRQN